jgi:hypothetical protein
MSSFYLPSSGQVLEDHNLYQSTGFSPQTNIDVLAANGVYIVNPASNPCDPSLYLSYADYTISGSIAEQSWSCVARPLDYAKEFGSNEVKTFAESQEAAIVSQSGLTTDILTAVSGQDPLDRPARFQLILDEMAAVSTQLDTSLTAIDSATSVDEIDSIIQQPSGTLVSGRGGAGPDDLHPSYFTVLTNLPPGIGEPELEIYIPGTDTVIPYDAGLPEPYKFDSAGNCYSTGDYRTTIRVAATGQVLSTVTPAFGPITPIEWTYNPNIPSLGGSSSSSAR